jgi:predicted lipase
MITSLVIGIVIFFVVVALLLSFVVRRAIRKIQYALNYATYNHAVCNQCKIDLSIRRPPPSALIMQYTPELSSFLIQEIYALEQSFHNKTVYTPPPGITEFKLLTTDDGPYGLILSSGAQTYILFRGSISDYEKQIDVKYTQQSILRGVACHDGFMELYKHIQPQLPTVKGPLILAGHSLGGAIASLCAVDMYESNSQKVLYTYGSPRVFGIGAMTVFKNVPYYRIVNTEDIIPTLPPAVIPNFTEPEKPFYYEHFGKPLSFTANWKCGLCNHLLPIYSQFVQL